MKTAPRPRHAWLGAAGTTSSPNSSNTSKTHADLFMIASLDAPDWSRIQDTTRDSALRLSRAAPGPFPMGRPIVEGARKVLMYRG